VAIVDDTEGRQGPAVRIAALEAAVSDRDAKIAAQRDDSLRSRCPFEKLSTWAHQLEGHSWLRSPADGSVYLLVVRD
jgi:hypothetical protein